MRSVEVLANVSFFVVLLLDMNDDRAIFLFSFVNDLIAGTRLVEHCLVMLNLVVVDLQRTLLAVIIFFLLGEN